MKLHYYQKKSEIDGFKILMLKTELICMQNSRSTGSNEWSVIDIPFIIPPLKIPSADKMKFSIIMSGRNEEIDSKQKVDLGEKVRLTVIRTGLLDYA